MWAKQLQVTNFRGFTSLDLDLDRPLTVLVGVNGSGKTSVLRAIAASQGWLQSVYDRRWDLPKLGFDVRDVRHGSSSSEIVCRYRHARCDFAFRVWWDATESRWQGLFHESSSQQLIEQPGRPSLFYWGTERGMTSSELRSAVTAGFAYDASVDPEAIRAAEDFGYIETRPGYHRFVEWFKEREDKENARRVASRNLDLEDPELAAVRRAVAALVPELQGLRMDRESTPATMVAQKGSETLRLDQLSDGERNLVALVGEFARRLVVTHPGVDDPLCAEVIVLLDEVEQHLHPAWQRRVLPSLRQAFPRTQWIVTTHSPHVVSSVDAAAVVLLEGGGARRANQRTAGRDANAILREVFGVPERPERDSEEVRAILRLIDDAQLEQAKERLETLAGRLSEADEAVVMLRTRLDFAEAGL
jgi:predicted ATP-binding protein involved in virulence